MRVILAETVREAELLALERGIPPKGSHTMLVATSKPGSADRCRGLLLAREDVIEDSSARRGRFYDEIVRTLEPAFLEEA